MNKYLLVLFVGLYLCPSSASSRANAPATQTPSPLAPIYACADKSDPAERLACFDAAVAAIKAAEARADIVTLDRPRVAAVRREAFGFRIPSLPRFGPPNGGAGASAASVNQAEEPVEEQSFVVERVSQANGRTTIFLTNGNVWQLVEAGELNAPGRPPFNVRIRSASLGSFILSVEGRNRGYRVRRLQ